MNGDLGTMAMQATVELGEGVCVLINALEVDDRTSWLRPGRSDRAPMNALLVRGESAGLVIDPGITVHGESVVGQLSGLVPEDFPLAAFFSRMGEFNCASNGAALLENFNVTDVWGAYPAENFLDFLPGTATAPESPRDWHGRSIEVHELGARDTIRVDPDREVLSFSSPLKLIATHWIYDSASRTLFSSDSFSHVYQSTEGNPWIVEGLTEDDTTQDQVRDHLLVKFEWLEGAAIYGIRRDLATIFERLDIHNIAPSYGCVLRGRPVVERHYQLVMDALEELDGSTPREKERQ